MTAIEATMARQEQADQTRIREAHAAMMMGQHYWVAQVFFKYTDDDTGVFIIDTENLRSQVMIHCLLCGEDDRTKQGALCNAI